MNYDEAVAWLYSTQGTGIKLGLESTRRLIGSLGLQSLLAGERETPPSPLVLHVAGTNGKGSVCAMLDAVCRSAGLRTGLFTSPHLVTYRERIHLDGAMIPEAAVAERLTRIRDQAAAWEAHPTFFEITTALAMDWFQTMGAEVIVLETGLGGRLDSTNAIRPAVSILTAISFDHRQYLGDTLESIATEKAGIIKPGIPVLSVPQLPEAAQAITETCLRVGAPLEWVDTPARFDVALPGSHQKLNAALAVAALRAARVPVSGEAIRHGLREVVWPGRFQRVRLNSDVGAELIMDGAHNEAAAERLVQTWRETFGEENPVIVLGAMGDKDVGAICRRFAPLGRDFIASPVRNARACDPETLAGIVMEAIPGAECTPAASLEAALELAAAKAGPAGRRVLVTGSFFLIGEALALLGGQPLEHASTQ